MNAEQLLRVFFGYHAECKMELSLYNTLTRTKEIFQPIEPGQVRMYTCGPTVYRFIHIGNLRSFMLADWMRRTLLAFWLRGEARQEHHRRGPHAAGTARSRRGQADRRRAPGGQDAAGDRRLLHAGVYGG